MTVKRVLYTGECQKCGAIFLGMGKSQYNRETSDHIMDKHRHADPDELCVELVTKTEVPITEQ